METFSQIMLFILSMLTTMLLVRTDNWKRWGYIVALASQPFWFYSSIVAGQFGTFCLSIFNTCFWVIGINNYWIKAKKK